MLGRDHALLAAVVAVGLGEPAARLARRPLPPAQLAAAGAITAAFALLPDLDEPGSTVSRKLGPLSRAVAKLTNTVAGGHRQATHSLVFAGAVGLAVQALARHPLTGPIVLYLSLALTIGMLVPGHLATKGTVVALLGPVAAGWWAWHAETGAWLSAAGPYDHLWWWLGWAASTGCVLHLVGDMLTADGVPLLWPWKRHLAVPLLGHTQSLREALLGACLSVGLVALAWVEVVGPMLRAGVGPLRL